MQKSDIAVSTLRDRVGEVIFERGRRYAAEGRVRLRHHGPAGAEAVVNGSEDYVVEIETARRGLVGSCTCPFAEDGFFCKHMVATVFRWLEEDVDHEAADGDADHEGTDDDVSVGGMVDDEGALRRFLAEQPLGWLVDELLDSAERDPLLRARLLVASGAPTETAFNETLMQQALVNAFSVEGFVGYREAADYFWDIGEALEEVAQLVSEGFAASAARLALFALDLVEEFGGQVDDSDGGLQAVIEQIEEIHLRASGAARPDLEKLAATLVERAVASDYEVFYSAAGAYAEVLGERGLAAYRDLVETRWRELPAGGDRFDADRFTVTFLREQVAEAIGGADALVEVLREDVESGYDHLRIARVLHGEGRGEEALEWTARGLEADGSDSRLRNLAAGIHGEAGRMEQAGELLWENFEEQPGIATYRELSSGTGADFPRWRDRALAVLKGLSTGEHTSRQDWSDVVSALLWEGEVDAAWDAACEGGCRHDLWLALARQRAQEHPSDALPVLLREADRSLEGGNRSAYRHAATLLGEARRLAARTDGLEEFDQHVRQVRERNRRRPALQDEFTRARLAQTL
ncbi:MAG: SWIM zinc finger family protein [Brachybacterium sp.]